MTSLRNCLRLSTIVLLAFAPLVRAADAAPHQRIPVVFHTDIGTDIDDTWALVQLLDSPELELKLVLTDTGDTRHRAALVAKILEVTGHSKVPIAIGRPGPTEQQPRNQESWLNGYDLAKYPGKVFDDGVAAFVDLIEHADAPITIISVSGATSLAAALERAPEIAKKCRFVGMHGSIDIGYGGKRESAAEWNVKVDPAALRRVLSAPWQDVLLTPLDTCGDVSVSGDDYHAVWCATDRPTARSVIENYCAFASRVAWMRCDFFAVRSTTLFDCVAVYLAYDEQLVETETLHLAVTDDGFTRRDPAGPAVRVALRWKNRGAFERDLAQRILGP